MNTNCVKPSAKNLLKASLAFAAISVSLLQSASAATIPFFSKPGVLDPALWYVSSGWTNGPIQSCEWRANAVTAFMYTDGPAMRLTLSNKGGKVLPIGCGEFHTNARTGYGTYEASMKTAAGSGLNTSFFTYVGPPVGVASHDEIDFEFLGKNSKTVMVNYWVGGVSKDGTIINLGFDASAAFHTYSFIWSPTSIKWLVDGKVVHTTNAGWKMPTQPGRIYLSLWSGSAQANAWLGPFSYKAPVTADYHWVKFTPQ